MRSIPLAVSLLAMLGSVDVAAQAPSGRPTTMVHIDADTPEAAAKIAAFPRIDILCGHGKDHVEALVFPEDVERLRELALDVEVVHEDIEAYWASGLTHTEPPNLAEDGSGGLPRGSMGGYLTWSEVVALLDSWRATYPNLITAKQSIGKTFENRDQWIVKISANADVDENEPEIYFESLIHAREPASMMCMMRVVQYMLQRYGTDPVITDLLDNREIWYVPVMNVDGYEYNRQIQPGGGGSWRKNRRPVGGGAVGVDLNRNFGFNWGFNNLGSSGSPSSGTYRGPSPFSEPAAQNVRDFILSRLDFGLTHAWDVHTSSGYCMWPWGYANVNTPQHAQYAEMANDMVAVNGYLPGIVNTRLYPINGGAEDWFHSVGLYGWLPELNSVQWGPSDRILALAEENLRMFLTAIKYAGPYLKTLSVTAVDVGNGNGVFEPGEKIEVRTTVRNMGVVAATGTELRLVSSSPFAVIEVGTVAAGTVSPFTNFDNTAVPLRAEIPAFTAPGTRLPLEIHHVFGGHTLVTPLNIVVGPANVLVNDTCETATWTMGVPGDDATDGTWAWGNPFRTSTFVNYAVQIGDDHTPGGGTNCYITGNQNTSNAGADDVDNGKTTLETSTYDLSNARNPYVQFWRWYMDHGAEPNNDAFTILVTDDGGSSWHVVDTVTYSDPQWRRHLFRLRDFVEPTAQVKLRFVAEDDPNDSFCEALIDDFAIVDYDDGVRIDLVGTVRGGETADIALTATRSANLGYLTAVALGSDPGIPLQDGRVIPLNPDPLLITSLTTPSVFQNFAGQLDGQGLATAQIALPTQPSLVGLAMRAAFITLDAAAPEGIRDISESIPLVVVE